MPKDLFSEQADQYALYRPTYPQALYDYIFSFVQHKQTAWDCATGNGQAALILSENFKQVFASDISESQLKQAPAKSNINYLVCPAEETPFPDNQFDLITVAQAYHWLKWDQFFKEASRVGKNGCVVAVWVYDLVRCEDEEINRLVDWFYKEITGPYWDAERKHVDNHYSTVQFHFEPLPSKEFAFITHYNKKNLLGYFSTWSALKNYKNQHHHSPLPLIANKLDEVWDSHTEKQFTFPIYLKMGKVLK